MKPAASQIALEDSGVINLLAAKLRVENPGEYTCIYVRTGMKRLIPKECDATTYDVLQKTYGA